jgi:acetyltransferase EpsM
MTSSGSIYLFGAGGHAKVIVEILESCGLRPAGLFDENAAGGQVCGYDVDAYPGKFDVDLDELIISIGNNAVRRDKAEKLQVNYTTAIHRAVTISPRATVGRGTVVMAGVIINSETSVGQHCIINTSASIDHDCVIGDFAHISPNATLCGTVSVGEGSHIGAGAVVIPGIKIGSWSTVGAGAVVIRDVPDNTCVVGSPARPLP